MLLIRAGISMRRLSVRREIFKSAFESECNEINPSIGQSVFQEKFVRGSKRLSASGSTRFP